MSDFDLTVATDAADAAVNAAAKKFIDAQLALELATSELQAAKAKQTRLTRALAILNGEEPAPAAAAPATAGATTAPPAAVPAPPPPAPPRYVGPYGHMACGACTTVGKMTETFRTTSKGGSYRALVCSECNNERIL